MKTAVFAVYKHTWEYALKLPPAFHIFLFGLVSMIKAVLREGSLARPPGCPTLSPEHKQKLLDGIPCQPLLSQLSTHKPKELASLETKAKHRM